MQKLKSTNERQKKKGRVGGFKTMFIQFNVYPIHSFIHSFIHSSFYSLTHSLTKYADADCMLVSGVYSDEQHPAAEGAAGESV